MLEYRKSLCQDHRTPQITIITRDVVLEASASARGGLEAVYPLQFDLELGEGGFFRGRLASALPRNCLEPIPGRKTAKHRKKVQEDRKSLQEDHKSMLEYRKSLSHDHRTPQNSHRRLQIAFTGRAYNSKSGPTASELILEWGVQEAKPEGPRAGMGFLGGDSQPIPSN